MYIYVHVYSCDALSNCGMHISSAVQVDLTAPVAPPPINVVPDAEPLYTPPKSEQRTPGIGPGVVWTSAEHISPTWNVGTYKEIVRGAVELTHRNLVSASCTVFAGSGADPTNLLCAGG